MKKVLLILALFCALGASAQPGYTYIAQRYQWLAGLFRALGLPAGAAPAFQTGQAQTAGSVYYDSVGTTLGVDYGLFIWDGSAWVAAGSSPLTLGEGTVITGDSIHIGGRSTAPAGLFTQNRTVNVNRKGLYWINGTIPTFVEDGGIDWSTFSQPVFSPYQFLSADTISAAADPPSAAVPWSGIYARRDLYTADGHTSGSPKTFGAFFEMKHNWKDTFRINTQTGGNYGVPLVAQVTFEPRGTGAQKMGIVSGIANSTPYYGVPVVLANIVLRNNGATNTIHTWPWIIGYKAMLYSTGLDTIERASFFQTDDLITATGKTRKIYGLDFQHATATGTYLDSSFGIWDQYGYNHWLRGNTVIGQNTGVHTWTSSDKLKIIGNLTTTDTVVVGAANAMTDTLGVDIVLRRRTNGGIEVIRADQLAPFLGGGTGVVNTGTANTLAYYPASTNAVDDLAAITANRALISDANGLPTHSPTTAAELAHVNGVTSAIQTQIDGKANTALSNLASVAVNTTIASDADNTDDLGTSSNSWKDIYTRTVKYDGATSGTVTVEAQTNAISPLVTTASGQGYGCSCMEVRETSDFTGQNVNTVQPMFNTAIDVWPLQGNTTYDFEGFLSLNHGAVSHSVGLSFELSGGASITSISYMTLQWVTAIGTQTASQTSNIVQVATNVAVNAAGANATEQIFFKGSISMNAAGNVTPSYTFSAAPGGTVLTKAGSYIKFCPKGTNTFTNIGPAN